MNRPDVWIPAQMMDDLKAGNLKASEFSLWVVLKSMEVADGEGVSIGLAELSERVGMAKTYLSAKLSGMERRGYIRKWREGRGRKVRRIIPVCPGRFWGERPERDREPVHSV